MKKSGTVQRGLMALCLGLSIVAPQLAVAQTVEEKPSFMAMAGDLLFVRPVMIVTTVVGAGLFLVSSPFSAAGGNIEQAADVLVVGPFETAFVRCLGCAKPKRWQPEQGAVAPAEPARR